MIDSSARLFSLCSSVVNHNEWGIASSRYACTIGAKNKGVKFFFNFFFVGVWGGGCVGVGRRVWVWARRDADGAGWMEAGWGWGGLDGGGMDGTGNRAPMASPSRIRIAGSGEIDRPTFRIPGSHVCAYLGWEKPLTPRTPHKMTRMPLGAHRML